MNELSVSFSGNLGSDPELRFTPTGQAVCTFRVAVTSRRLVDGEWKDGATSWPQCQVWGESAERVAEFLRKGDRVLVVGTMSQRSFDTKDGQTVTVWDVRVDEIGPSLKFRGATPSRTVRDPQREDPWAGTDAVPATPSGD